MQVRLCLALFIIFAGLASAHPFSIEQTVKNTEKGLWGGSRAISLHEEMIIGKEIGEESEMFGYIRALTIDATDNIYVADSYELNISVYSSGGEFLREFGREGQGPGEFQTLDGICWCEKDNNLYIADRRNHRISRFSPEGKQLGAVKDKVFDGSIQDICCLKDGRFVLTVRTMGDNQTDNKIFVTDFLFENVIAKIRDEFPSHIVGMKWMPLFSDVGIIDGDQIYYTSPSEYKINILDPDFSIDKTILKSHPRMFIPQYVQGFYADFNTIETLLVLEDMYVVGVQSTQIKNIPRFKTKREFIEFTHTPDLREWDLEKAYQLDLYDKEFKFLGYVEISKNRCLAGKDSKNKLYFIEQDPYPRVVRCRLEIN